MVNPKVFISYSWESEKHNDWVRNFAARLRNSGVDVRLDQWDLCLGMDVLQFMESAIRDSDYVLLVCTPNFAIKANSLEGGVGYEKSVITGEIFQGIAQPGKFIPILRTGDAKISLPSYLKPNLFADFRKDPMDDTSFDGLLRNIHKQPRFVPPPIGSIPNYSGNKMVVCDQCGARVGTTSPCLGGGIHTFKGFSVPTDQIVCQKCGGKVGTTSPCLGGGIHTFNGFLVPKEQIVCDRCGARVGTNSPCLGGGKHNFKAF